MARGLIIKEVIEVLTRHFEYCLWSHWWRHKQFINMQNCNNSLIIINTFSIFVLSKRYLCKQLNPELFYKSVLFVCDLSDVLVFKKSKATPTSLIFMSSFENFKIKYLPYLKSDFKNSFFVGFLLYISLI